MAETVTTEAPGTETGAETETETQGSITTLEELTASFVDKVEEAEAQQESEASEESETQPEADAETDEKDVRRASKTVGQQPAGPVPRGPRVAEEEAQ